MLQVHGVDGVLIANEEDQVNIDADGKPEIKTVISFDNGDTWQVASGRPLRLTPTASASSTSMAQHHCGLCRTDTVPAMDSEHPRVPEHRPAAGAGDSAAELAGLRRGRHSEVPAAPARLLDQPDGPRLLVARRDRPDRRDGQRRPHAAARRLGRLRLLLSERGTVVGARRQRRAHVRCGRPRRADGDGVDLASDRPHPLLLVRGIPHGTVSRTARYPAQHGALRGCNGSSSSSPTRRWK